MRIYGEPGLSIHVNKRICGRLKKFPIFTFNEDGYVDVDISRFKPETLAKIKARFKTEEKELKHCKKCEFTCENQGDLLAHYRTAHKKEG